MRSRDGERNTGPMGSLVFFSALSIASRGLSLLLLPVYVSFLSPADYGALATILIAATVLAVPANLKLDAALRTFYYEHERDPAGLNGYLRQIFSASLLFAALYYLALLCGGDALFRLVLAHDEIRFFPAGAVAAGAAVINSCLSTYFVYLRNGLRLAEIARWQGGLLAATAATQILLVAGWGWGIAGVVWGSLAPSALALLSLCMHKPGLLTLRLDPRLLAPAIRYATPLIALGILYTLGTRLDRLVLEHYAELEALGGYAVLIALLGLLKVVLSASDNAIRPFLYPAMKSPSADTSGTIAACQRLYVVVGLMALSGVVLLGANLHVVTDGAAYLSARSLLPLAATAFAPAVFTQLYALPYDCHKRSLELTAGTVGRFLLLLTLLLLLAPRYSARGALYATLAADSAAALLFALRARRFEPRAFRPDLALQLALFLGAIWLTARWTQGASASLFGAAQFTVVSIVLLAANRRVLVFAMNGLPEHAGRRPHMPERSGRGLEAKAPSRSGRT